MIRQPLLLLIKITLLLTISFLVACGNGATHQPSSTTSGNSATHQPSPTTSGNSATHQPSPTTNESCAWTWATGSGSSAVEDKVRQEFTTAAITGTVYTSSYGENYSCDGSYHVMGLDINIEVQVADTRDEARLAKLADSIDAIIQKALIGSTIPNKGRVSIRFVRASNAASCEWDIEKRQCRL